MPVASLPPAIMEIETTGNVTTFDNSSQTSMTCLFPGWDGGSYIDRERLDDASKQLFPARLIVVFGLESSGTTFVQDVIAKAAGATKKSDVEILSPDRSLRVQHFSLPTGWFPSTAPRFKQRFEALPIVPMFVPLPCRLGPGLQSRPSPSQCRFLFGPAKVPSESRYFINVTSHVNFYRKRGVDVKTVIVVRDPALHFRGIHKSHCGNETAAYEQYKTGRAILEYAMDHLVPNSFMIFSYETLMTLRGTYMKELYKFLNIKSSYSPNIKNGNIPYIPKGTVHESITTKLQDDKEVAKPLDFPPNLYEPKSLAEIRSEMNITNQ